MAPGRTLDEYAARQYGVFTLEQARRTGHTAKMIHTRVANGSWMRLAPSVFALASAPPHWERQMAAALMSRDGSVAAGRSAAYLHGFEGFGPTRPVIMVGADDNARSPLARVIRSKRFESLSTVRRRGFVITNEAETILTLSRELNSDRLEGLVDWVLARQGCTVRELFEVVEMSPGLPGVGKLRPIVEYRLPEAYQPPTTTLERLLFRILDDPRLPSYTRQMPIRFERVTATVDAYLPAWRLIVEGDGRRWHNRRADHERDRLRDNEATAHGYAVLRFTYEMLRDRPSECLDTVIRTGWVRRAS
jgi:very-short-patch-repair endonuclease